MTVWYGRCFRIDFKVILSLSLSLGLIFGNLSGCQACGPSATSTTTQAAEIAKDLAKNLFGPKSRNLFPEFKSRSIIPTNFEQFFTTTTAPFSRTSTDKPSTTTTTTTTSTTSTTTTRLTTTISTLPPPPTRVLTVTGFAPGLKQGSAKGIKKVFVQPGRFNATAPTQRPYIVTGKPWRTTLKTRNNRNGAPWTARNGRTLTVTLPTVRQTTSTESVPTIKKFTLLARGSKDSPRRYPRDCSDIQKMGLGQKSGVYKIFRPSCLNPVHCAMDVNCDLQTDGGGWTIIQQRLDGTTSFFRDWKSYRNGFGDSKNFWLGNEYVYEISNMFDTKYSLLVQMSDFNGRSRFSLYQNFKLESETENYTLRLGSVFGTTNVDNFRASRDVPFGTFDEDHDIDGTRTCGAHWLSGWWHHPACDFAADLNVPYKKSRDESQEYLQGIMWITDDGPVSIRSTQMKIRPTDFLT